MHVAVYVPLCGSSHIPTPKKLVRRKAVLNVKNDDNRCFIWSTKYVQYMCELNLEGLRFPMTINQVGKFEAQNGISVNVFGYDNEVVFPLHITPKHDVTHINLLFISEGDKQHYCLITNMSRLLNDRTQHNGEEFYCNYCLHAFRRQDLLDDHSPYCRPHGPQRISMPKEDNKWLKFKHLAHQLRDPFVIYADFECYTEPINSCQPTDASTQDYQHHTPSGFCYYIVSDQTEYTFNPVVYRGPDVVDTFLTELQIEEKRINDILSNPTPITMTKADVAACSTATECHICREELGADKVRNHCHLTGLYRGAAHSECNLQYRFLRGTKFGVPSFFIPVMFHNLRGYDSHLIIPALGRHRGNIRCIPNNMEKYMSFSMGQLRFIDSFQFMSISLEKLVANLPDDGFVHVERHTTHTDLLKWKGVYPYDYMDSPKRLEETCLPPKSSFFSRLTDTDISDNDYVHAQNVWRTFNLNTLGDYHDLYMKTDVLLLADIFERFRCMCLSYYGLDHAHYYTAP